LQQSTSNNPIPKQNWTVQPGSHVILTSNIPTFTMVDLNDASLNSLYNHINTLEMNSIIRPLGQIVQDTTLQSQILRILDCDRDLLTQSNPNYLRTIITRLKSNLSLSHLTTTDATPFPSLIIDLNAKASTWTYQPCDINTFNDLYRVVDKATHGNTTNHVWTHQVVSAFLHILYAKNTNISPGNKNNPALVGLAQAMMQIGWTLPLQKPNLDQDKPFTSLYEAFQRDLHIQAEIIRKTITSAQVLCPYPPEYYQGPTSILHSLYDSYVNGLPHPKLQTNGPHRPSKNNHRPPQHVEQPTTDNPATTSAPSNNSTQPKAKAPQYNPQAEDPNYHVASIPNFRKPDLQCNGCGHKGLCYVEK
jgi:hypothetical protein